MSSSDAGRPAAPTATYRHDTWRARWGLTGLGLLAAGICALLWAIARIGDGIDLADSGIELPPDALMAVLSIGGLVCLLAGSGCLWWGFRRVRAKYQGFIG
ncbi:MAG: hypothetical protein WKF57_18065 [Nakamurella sp.]